MVGKLDFDFLRTSCSLLFISAYIGGYREVKNSEYNACEHFRFTTTLLRLLTVCNSSTCKLKLCESTSMPQRVCFPPELCFSVIETSICIRIPEPTVK